MNRSELAVKLKTMGISGVLVRLFLVWFAVAFLIIPNVGLFIGIFFKEGRFSLEAVHKLLSSGRALRSLSNSFILAITIVVTVNIVGTLLVLFTEYFDIKGAKILRIGYMTTLIYQGVVLVSGYKFIYGANGLLTKLLTVINPGLDPNWFTGYFAVVFILTFACTSNHIIFLANAIRGMDFQIVEAAKNLGASFTRIFFTVVLPILKPTFFAITILTFLTGVNALSAPLMVGGDNFQTINPMIIQFAQNPFSRDIAALLSAVLGVVTIVLLIILSRVEKGGNYISISKTKSRMVKQKIVNPIANVFAHGTAYFLFLIYTVPILLVVLYSFSDSDTIAGASLSFKSFTLENYKTIFLKAFAYKPYIASVIYSLLGASGAALIGILVSRIVHKTRGFLSSALEYSMLIPWLLPGTLIALGLMMTYDVPRFWVGNKVLIGTFVLLPLAYIIVKIPFSLRMIKAAFFSLDGSLEESARCMGASPLYTLIRVIIPTILPAVLSVIVLNFNVLLADYDLTVFLFHPLFQPLGIMIVNSSDEYATVNARAISFVYAVVLMLISSAALYFTGRDGRKNKSWTR